MLINAHYLDENALTNYIAAIEGGLRDSGTSRTTGAQGLGGSVGHSNVAKVEAQKGNETENTLHMKDHQASRLQRLIKAAHTDPEGTAWIQTSQPDVDFPEAGIGAFIEWECDVYIPEAIATMSQNKEMSSMLQTIKAFSTTAETLGFDTKGMPDESKIDAMGSFVSQLDVAPVVIGEDSNTDWKIVGSLDKQWISPTASFDGPARIIGKIKKTIKQGHWYPLFSLPGMNILGREEKRRQERNGPKNNEDKDKFVSGPLLVVDFLAIYN